MKCWLCQYKTFEITNKVVGFCYTFIVCYPIIRGCRLMNSFNKGETGINRFHLIPRIENYNSLLMVYA